MKEVPKVRISQILFQFRHNTCYSSQASQNPPKKEQTIRKHLGRCSLELWVDVLHIFSCTALFSFIRKPLLGFVIVSSIFIAPSHLLDPVFVLQICCHKSLGSFDSLDVPTFSVSMFVLLLLSNLYAFFYDCGRVIVLRWNVFTKQKERQLIYFNLTQLNVHSVGICNTNCSTPVLVSFSIWIFMNCTANMDFDDS